VCGCVSVVVLGSGLVSMSFCSGGYARLCVHIHSHDPSSKHMIAHFFSTSTLLFYIYTRVHIFI